MATNTRPGLIPNSDEKDFATMRRVHPNITYRNDIDLPLFAWARRQAERKAQHSSPAPSLSCWQVRAFARQNGLPLNRAKLVAELTGLPTGDGEAGS